MNEIVSFTKKIEFKTLIYEITSISLEHTLMSYDDETIKGDLIVRGTYKQTIASQIDNPFNYKIPIDIAIDSKYDISDMNIDIDNFTYEVKEENVLQLNIDLILDKLKLKEIKEVKEKEEDVLIKLEDLFKEEETKEKLEFDPPKEIRNTEEKNDKEEKKEEKEPVEIKNEEPRKLEKEESIQEERNEKIKEEAKKEERDKKDKETVVEENNRKEPQETKKETIEKETKLERIPQTKEDASEDESEHVMEEDKSSSVSESLFAKLDTTSETYKTYSIYIVREDDSIDEIMKKYNVKKENLEEYNNLSEVKKGTKLIIPCNNE